MGPVQVLVVALDRPASSGEVLAEFDRLRAAGTVRLVGLLLVARGEDGSLESLDMPEDVPPGLGLVAAALLGEGADADGDGARRPDRDDDEPGWSLAAVPRGSTAAVALIEHLWAAPLAEALGRAGGRPLEETWLGPEDRRTLEKLLEQEEVRR